MIHSCLSRFRPALRRGRASLPVLGLALLLTLASSCGSDSKTGAGTPAASAVGSAAATQSPPTQVATTGTPAGVPSAPIDPSTVQLQLDPGARDAYTIEVPVGWQAENIPAPTGFGRRYTLFDSDGTRRAQVTVTCASGSTVDKLVAQDNGIVSGLGGSYAIGGYTDVVVGGLSGKETRYSLAEQSTLVVYLQGKVCGWQILQQAYGAGQLDRFLPLFKAVLATFKPLAGG